MKTQQSAGGGPRIVKKISSQGIHRLGTCSLLLLLSLVLLPAAEAPAQDAEEPQDGNFEDVSQVLNVQIPVNVILRNGDPVRGLTAEDFEVTSDGEKQEITSFEIVDLEVLGSDIRPAQADGLIPQAARRHVLLLFDLTFSDATAIVRAREAAREFVFKSLHPADLVAVATHSVDTGSQLVVTFTPDRAQLIRAIDTLGAPRLLHLVKQDPLSFVIDDPLNQGGTTGSDTGGVGQTNVEANVAAHLRVISKQINKMERSYARGRIFSWASSMGELARFLDSVKGRKQVVYFTEGFDGRLLLGRPADPDDEEASADRLNIQMGDHWMVDSDDVYGNTPLQNDVASMIEQFTRADCVIQAVDISGLRADSLSETRGASVGQDALFWVANETGGSLYREANNLGEQLHEVLAGTSVTYLLTFSPEDIAYDGAYHRIKVKADTPRGARVSFRKGYYAPRPFQDLHPLEKSLLASGAIASAETRDDLDLDILTASFRANDQLAYVPVIIEVPGAGLLDGHEDDLMSVEIYGYVTNAAGEMRDFFTQMVSLNVGADRESFGRSGLKYYSHMDLPEGEYLIRVLVRNAQTGRTGVQVSSLTIPKYKDGDPILLPPFFPEPPATWHLARETESRFRRTVVYPFTVNGEPYVPAARPMLDATETAKMFLVVYNLGEGTVGVDGRIVDAEGELVAEEADINLVERTVTGISGLDKLMATFKPQGLEAGSYRLEVTLRDENGPASFNSIPFTVLN
jgi:VWFA-related protein